MVTRPTYSGTNVPVSRSQEELRRTLLKFGADQFTFGESRGRVQVEFVHADQLVRLRCPLGPTDPATVRSHASTADKKAMAEEREAMRVWRVLLWSIKARLVAVDEGVESFEEAFLSHLVDPVSDHTMWETMSEPIEAGAFRLGGGGMKALGAAR